MFGPPLAKTHIKGHQCQKHSSKQEISPCSFQCGMAGEKGGSPYDLVVYGGT